MPGRMSLDEVIDRCARNLIEVEQLRMSLGCCEDAIADALDELAQEGIAHPRAHVLARAFEIWLDDERAQEWHARSMELHARARRLLDEWKRGEP